MLINGLEITDDDFSELRYLVDWKCEDLEEQMRDDYYNQWPEELPDLQDELSSFCRVQEFLSKLNRGASHEA